MSDRRRNRGLILRLAKQTQFCMSLIALCLQNGNFQNAVTLPIYKSVLVPIGVREGILLGGRGGKNLP